MGSSHRHPLNTPHTLGAAGMDGTERVYECEFGSGFRGTFEEVRLAVTALAALDTPPERAAVRQVADHERRMSEMQAATRRDTAYSHTDYTTRRAVSSRPYSPKAKGRLKGA